MHLYWNVLINIYRFIRELFLHNFKQTYFRRLTTLTTAGQPYTNCNLSIISIRQTNQICASPSKFHYTRQADRCRCICKELIYLFWLSLAETNSILSIIPNNCIRRRIPKRISSPCKNTTKMNPCCRVKQLFSQNFNTIKYSRDFSI